MRDFNEQGRITNTNESVSTAKDKLRGQLFEIMGVDRWVVADYPAIALTTVEEVIRLMKGYPGTVMVVGTGTNFPLDYTPPPDVLNVLTGRLTERFEHSIAGCTVEVSAGWTVKEVRERLKQAGYRVPALDRFIQGSIGGRLASVSSLAVVGRFDGWNHFLLGLDVVTPEGELIRMGGRNIKDVAGYNLRSLFTGSRGAIGIIVGATFRTIPLEANLPQFPTAETKDKGSPEPIFYTGAKYEPSLKRLFDPRGRMCPGP